MRRLLFLAFAVCAVGAAGCYSYAPARSSQARLHVAALPDPDAIAVVSKPEPKNPHPLFTFVDGGGNELTLDELEARYVRVVGHDDVADALGRNKVTAVTLVIGVGVAATALAAWGIAECARAPGSCNGSTQGKLGLGEIEGLAMVVGGFVGIARSPHDLALLTKGQARELAARYDRALALRAR